MRTPSLVPPLGPDVPSRPRPRLSRHTIALPDELWHGLRVRAALERKPGCGDIVRKAVRRYLLDTLPDVQDPTARATLDAALAADAEGEESTP